MTTRGQLTGALAYLREHGWTQGVYRDGEGRVCAAGALMCAVPRGDTSSAFTALYRAVELGTLSGWNDAPDRTQAEVEAFYEAVIAREPA